MLLPIIVAVAAVVVAVAVAVAVALAVTVTVAVAVTVTVTVTVTVGRLIFTDFVSGALLAVVPSDVTLDLCVPPLARSLPCGNSDFSQHASI